jgi:putative SOS response-associated peptidase YedK
MCGRYALISEPAALVAQFAIAPPSPFAPRYNIAPSQAVLVVRHEHGEPRATHHAWGLLPAWSKDPRASRRPINARAETISDKPSFRAAFRRRRCLVPADGYYEWAKRGTGKQAFYLYGTDHQCFAMAGVWETWERDGTVIESCALITRAANTEVSQIHDRMPVIIAARDYGQWLGQTTPNADINALVAAGGDQPMSWHAVSKRVNSPANDGVECVQVDVESDA